MSAQQDSPRRLILLVDDCVDSRELYAEALAADFRVAVAGTGAEAVQRASELLPALVVMDWSLPDMGGEEAIARIREDPRTNRVPVVVVSGYAEPRERRRVWDAYFVKPCPADALSSCIARMLDGQAARETVL